MNLRQIQELIKFVAKSGATEVDIEIGDVKLSIKSPPKGKVNNTNAEALTVHPQVLPVAQPLVTNPITSPQPQVLQQAVSVPQTTQKDEVVHDSLNKKNESNTQSSDNENYITIKAPIIGTFYRRSSPDKEPFINVGDKIEEGQSLCIIEAMKLFNEIESEFSGTIVKVLVEDMSPVEYDQPLFLIDPA
tara:strand:+ start:914 stop:1480 length:567 start_codon:yes stop_codon:yes gene_type:complete